MKTFQSLRVFSLIILSIGALALILQYHNDNASLDTFASKKITNSTLPSETVIALAESIRQEIRTKRNPGYLLAPPLSVLRATPVQVAESGGDCSDKSRLLITMLRLKGIAASKVALYDAQDIPRHAVVEAVIENGNRMAVDPLYGLYFPRAEGGYYAVADIRKDASILTNRLAELVALGKDQKRPPLWKYPLQKYTYQQPRTINWDKSIIMQTAYKILKFVIGERVNHIERPYFVERPVLMLLYAVVGGILFILATWLPAIFRNRKLKRLSIQRQFDAL